MWAWAWPRAWTHRLVDRRGDGVLAAVVVPARQLEHALVGVHGPVAHAAAAGGVLVEDGVAGDVALRGDEAAQLGALVPVLLQAAGTGTGGHTLYT